MRETKGSDMLLSEHRIVDFLEVLASPAPAPGGGSASALAGALGVALVSMVAHLTSGKERYRDEEPLMREILLKVNSLQVEMVRLIDEDAQAFNDLAAIFKMPGSSAEEKSRKKEAMDGAFKKATLVPYAVMEAAVAALELLEAAWGHTNPRTDSDLGVSALCLKTAVQGGWLNVLINLGGIKDEAFVSRYSKEGERLSEKGAGIADRVLGEVYRSLRERR